MSRLEATLTDYLRHKRLLLLLDNCEHVLGAAPLIGRLLTACPGVKALATSRAALRVYGERELPIPPLALPDPKRLPPLAELATVESVELFVERTLAWLGRFRRLAIRSERRADIHLAFVALARALICFDALDRF